MSRALTLFAVLLVVLTCPLFANQLEPSGSIKIGFFSLEPISFLGQDNQALGFNPDLLREIARLEKWEPVFVYGSWGDGIDRLESGEIDLMMNVAYTTERVKKLDYNLEASMELWGQVFIRPGDGIQSIEDLAGQRVGIMRRGINGRNFVKTANDLGISCEFVTYENLTEIFRAVQAGDILAGVSPQHYGLKYAGQYDLVPSSIVFSPFPIYFAAKKGQHPALLKQIDEHLRQWKEKKDSFYYERLNHWLGKQATGSFIPAWIIWTLLTIAATALLLLFISLLFKRQVKKKAVEVVEAHYKLRESRNRYRDLIDSMIQPMALYEAIYISDRKPIDFRFVEINPALCRMYGRSAEDIIGKSLLELRPDTDPLLIENFCAVVRERNPVHFEIDLSMFGKHFDIVAYSPAPDQVTAVGTDITEKIRSQQEQNRLQTQFYQAQKLESLGVLAGGIAHDFNNILMAILGHCELALRRSAKESPAKDNIEQIKSSANKAAELSNQMLAYSGKGKFVVEPVDLSRIVDEMQQILHVSISKKAVLRLDYAENLPSVEADITQLRQIILNLVINASDAVGDKSGVIAITTGVMDCTEAYLQDSWLDEQLPAGQYVFLEVADTGCGMDKATIQRIFEPFFTTKFTGRGLGMAAVLGIVRSHHGAIKVYSEENQGTTFKILLPAVAKPAALFGAPPELEPLVGEGTVLLVDDDETVRSIGREMLEEFGFTVITANDGREAVEKYQQEENIFFVLMDLTMPHLDGEQAFRELRRIDPDVKVIMSSGYNEQEIAQKFAGKGINGFLKKPYQLGVLQQAIQEL